MYMFNSAEYLQKVIKDYENGLITIEQMSKRLHHIIDDVTIPDAIHTSGRTDHIVTTQNSGDFDWSYTEEIPAQ